MPKSKCNSEPCPCGSGKQYSQCCEPLLTGKQSAVTAEALMRSRYTAYVIRDEKYLCKTWHPSTRPPATSLGLETQVKWLGLEILNTQAGSHKDKTGQVEFIARYKISGKAQRMRETSRFIQEQAQWYYLDGQVSG